MAKPLWYVNLIKRAFPKRRFLAKLTKAPLLGRLVDKMLFEGDDVMYLPKDSVAQMTIQIGKKLDRPEEAVLPSEIVHHFIEKANYHSVLIYTLSYPKNPSFSKIFLNIFLLSSSSYSA